MSRSSVTAGVSLSELLSASEQIGGGAVRAQSCTNDWRAVQPGDVFVAVAHAEHDGHDHAHQAVERGAIAVVGERWLPVFDVPQWIVPDSRAAYGEICHALVGNPSESIRVIGVSGTCGKTSVVALTEAVLRAAGARTGSLSNLGVVHDDYRVAAPLETPPADQLAQWLAELDAAACTHAVLEVSSAALCQARLAGVQLDAACLTQIGNNHLDLHGSLDNYRRAKEQLFDHLTADGIAVINADDPQSVRVGSQLVQPMLTYGIRQIAEVTAQIVEQHVNEQTFLLIAGTQTAAVQTEIIGTHHVANCLAAATLGLAYDIDLTTIARGLESLRCLPGRMERITAGQDFALFIDDAHGADSLEACLRAARQVAGGKVLCVFGTQRATGQEAAAILRVLTRQADQAILTSGSFVASAIDAEPLATEQVKKILAVPHAAGAKIEVISDRLEAIARILALASPGDVVVVAGNGNLRAGYGEDVSPGFGDREAVLELLQQSAASTELERAA